MKQVVPLTQVELDTFRCGNPDCCTPHEEGIVLVSSCHEEAGVYALYQRGVLHLLCVECQAYVHSIAVASRHTPKTTHLTLLPGGAP
jgi:hypothetical protein